MRCRNKWVDVVHMQGDDYSEISDMGIQEMAEHLAQWDYGCDTDEAHTVTGQPWHSDDTTYPVSVGGLDYVLVVNSRFGYASLNRRPL